ncbi:MAG: cupin [Gemmatimonadetes bacterium]|nr:cupin [Gemmatimonadota bacterium]
MSDPSAPIVVNIEDVEEITRSSGEHWGASYKPITPALSELEGGRLGVNLTRLEKGRTVCPFHAHQRSDEVFYVLSGRGVLRYGVELIPIRAGDCISCPAGNGVAHQIANPHNDDLVYLAIGANDPDEVAVYPDSGKVLVRSLRRIGRLESMEYMDGEPERPRVFELIDERLGGEPPPQ